MEIKEVCLGPSQDRSVRTIVLQREKGQPIGVNIVGGKSKPGKIHVSGIRPGSVADVDGRLKVGDRILELDKMDFRNITHG